MINDGDAPRHYNVIANDNASVADEIATSNEGSASDPDFTALLLETDVRMNNRLVPDRQSIA